MHTLRVFDRRSALFLVLLCLPLLFLPKINLVKLGKETAGLRIDDLVLLCFCVVLGWANIALRKHLTEIEAWMVALVSFSFLSLLSNHLLVTFGILPLNAKIFYCVRILEYFLFFYVGVYAANFFSCFRIITAFLLWNASLMILQKFGLIGEFSSTFGYNAEASARVAGIASFPSEMGALLNMIFCYYLFDTARHVSWERFSPGMGRFVQHTYVYWLFLIFAVLVIMTGSRVAIVALIVPVLFKLKDMVARFSIRTLILSGLFLIIAACVIAYSINKTEAIVARSKGLLSWRNIELITAVWNTVDLSGSDGELTGVAYGDYDMSWWVRIHKWCYALRTYVHNPICYLQGLGPGFTGMALDGGLLRILVEYGLIGCFLSISFSDGSPIKTDNYFG